MEHDEKHYFNFTLTVYGDFNTILHSMVKSIVTTSSFDLRSLKNQPAGWSSMVAVGRQRPRCESYGVIFWLVVTGTLEHGWIMTFHIYIGNGIIIPTDFHIFQRGRYTTNQYWFYNVFTVHVSVCSWSNWCGFFVRIQGRQPNQPTNRGLFGIRRRIVPPSCKFVYKPHELNVVISCYIYHKYP